MAVRYVIAASQRIRERVHSGRVHRPEAESAIQAAQRHLLAGGKIRRLAHRVRKRAGDEAHTLDGPDIHHRMRELVGISLNAMRERIQAGRSGDRGWNAQRQLGVNKGRIGYEPRTDHAFLHLVGIIEQDGVRRNFAARAGRCGHADQQSIPALDQADAEDFADLLLSVEESGHEFGHVERASAT